MIKIFYPGGLVHEGEGPPARGVQIILQDDGDGPYFQSGSDFYVWTGDGWLGVDKFGLYDWLIESGLVLFGRTITNKEYRKILKKAKVKKATWRPDERKP